MKAQEFCEKAAALMNERGKQYDKPEGARSMARTVAAFNAVTGRDLSESEGWLLMLLLKQVRQWQQPGRYHADSAEDSVAYSALLAEALAAQQPSLPIPEPAKLPLLPLVVGGTYRTRSGERVVLTAEGPSSFSPFTGRNTSIYDLEGRIRSYDRKGHEFGSQDGTYDLVERIS